MGKGKRKGEGKGKGKAVPLQTWSGPVGSRKLRFTDFMTTVQDGGKVGSLTHRLPLPQEITWDTFLLRGWVDPRANQEYGYPSNMGTLPIQSWNCLQFSSHTMEVANFMLFILCVFLPSIHQQKNSLNKIRFITSITVLHVSVPRCHSWRV